MACERDLDRRSKDPDPRVPSPSLGRTNTVSEKFISRASRWRSFLRDLAGVGEDRDLVAFEGLVREDIGDHVTEIGHQLRSQEPPRLGRCRNLYEASDEHGRAELCLRGHAVRSGRGGAVWSAERGPVVTRIDPRTGRSATAVTGGGNGLASTGNAL